MILLQSAGRARLQNICGLLTLLFLLGAFLQFIILHWMLAVAMPFAVCVALLEPTRARKKNRRVTTK